MYVILTSKPGIYKSELETPATVAEAYRYLFYGHCRAVFQIVEIAAEGMLCITEDEPPHIQNHVSTKFLGHFDDLEGARRELNHLVRFGGLQATLQPCEVAAPVA